MAKRRIEQRMLCNTLHIKLKIEQHQPHSENIEHTQLVIRSVNRRADNAMAKRKRTKQLYTKHCTEN
jgi:hypothetical protein